MFNKNKWAVWFCMAFIGFPVIVIAQTKVWLTSLEWPPYVGKNLKGRGINTVVLVKVFKEMGSDLVVELYPWERARRLAVNDPYLGYFPAAKEEIPPGFIASDPIFMSPLGVAELKTAPLDIQNIHDFIGKRIGVVQGYSYSDEFDALAAKGSIKTDSAPSDLINLKKLSGGRFEGAMVYLHNLKYLLNHEPELIPYKDKIQANSFIVCKVPLYIAFRDTSEGNRIRKSFNVCLKKVAVQKIIDEFIAKQ